MRAPYSGRDGLFGAHQVRDDGSSAPDMRRTELKGYSRHSLLNNIVNRFCEEVNAGKMELTY